MNMVIRYPVRNFRCPFCGAKMPTEQYNGWKPWKCPGCSAELQFSQVYGQIVQLCFFGVALLILYLLGLRGWKLFGAVVLAGPLLTIIFIGPLGRIVPPQLEPYSPQPSSPWKQPKFVTLFPRENADGNKPNKADRPENEPPKEV